MPLRFLRRLRPAPSGIHPDFRELPLKQLMMVAYRSECCLQRPVLPAGYSMRTYRPGDEESWIDLIHGAGFGKWTRRHYDEFMDEPERKKGSHLVERDGELVAATFASRYRLEPRLGAIDFVVCLPEFRGRRLGKLTTVAVMEYLFENDYESVVLYTDDDRWPAIKIYFEIGFRPVINRIDMAARWRGVRSQLGQ